jgi:hypothetical protein
MAQPITYSVTLARRHLIEPTANFWSDDELAQLAIQGVKDLWRDIVDLKQEHFLTKNVANVSYQPSTTTLTGVPLDVHKVYMIEPLDLSVNGANHGLLFKPLPYNDNQFQLARSRDPIDPTNDTVYYAISGQGSPVGAPVIDVAPRVTSAVKINFVYVPTLAALQSTDNNPIPGESDNAVVAWIVAYARAKEREDRSPDPLWVQIYSTEKAHLLQSLGLRQYQEPSYAEAMFVEYW